MTVARPTLVVALDVSEAREALRWCEELSGLVDHVKVGSELFTAAGPSIVSELVHSGLRVFLDLKFHDIPHTVSRAVAAAGRLGVALVDVHVSGGMAMMSAASRAAQASASEESGESSRRPKVLGVTVLTHLGDEDLAELGVPRTSFEQGVRLAQMARRAGLDGVVASAWETRAIREATEDALAVLVPGVRPAWARTAHDQKRVATPGEAAKAGARYVVVGRAITESPHPRDAASRILDELESAERP